MSMQQNTLLIAQQQCLIEIVKKIQEIVDFEEICQFINTQVRELLKSDAVCVYEFGGKIWGDNRESQCFPDGQETFSKESLEEVYKIYAQEDGILVVDDFQKLVSKKDAVSLTEAAKKKAQIMVPIICQQQKWGLFFINDFSQPRHWQPEEIYFVKRVALHLNIAVEKCQMYQEKKKHQKNINKAIDTAIEQQTTIANLIDKIRRSLNIDTILTTATQEARTLLKADRVAIYRFNEDYSGEFIVESVAQGWR